MQDGWVSGRAPATIANVGPGFDVLALAIRGPSDEVALRPADRDSLSVEGVGAKSIPANFTENTAGIVLEALRRATGLREKLEVHLRKGIPAARGLGSSAASGAAAALAFLKAFPESRSLGPAGFIRAAVEGEAAVSGRHFDNISGALLGGFVSIASTDPLVLRRETVGDAIHLAVAVPETILRTADMRQVLPDSVSFRAAVGNLGKASTLALALVQGDAGLAGRCLEDRFAEPPRSAFLPGYAEARAAALGSGATGFAICGSGSSVFAIAESEPLAERTAHAMRDAFASHGVPAHAFVTHVDNSIPMLELVRGLGPRFSLLSP
ncbi:MAG TPA: homoserine kinase [Thermoplasmata archaeon]|nr:homoserine kinase [Thermoplasmata archaeon]